MREVSLAGGYAAPDVCLTRWGTRQLMQDVAEVFGFFGVPLYPDGAVCDASCTVCADPVAEVASLDRFGCRVSGSALLGLMGAEQSVWGVPFTGFRLVDDPAGCPRRVWLVVPDTIDLLVDQLVKVMRPGDDAEAGVDVDALLADMRMPHPPTIDDMSTAQLAAIGIPAAEQSRLLTEIAGEATQRSVSVTQSEGAELEHFDVWVADFGGGELRWYPGTPLRLYGHQLFCVDSLSAAEWDPVLSRLQLRQGAGNIEGAQNPGEHVCSVRLDAPRLPWLDTKFRGELVAERDPERLGPWWPPDRDQGVRPAMLGVAADPPTPAAGETKRPSGLPEHAELDDGGPATGQVSTRMLCANPWNGGRFWHLRLKVAEAGLDRFWPAHIEVVVLCPYDPETSPVRVGDLVTLPTVRWTINLDPPLPPLPDE